jgi:hypothetical protein
MGFLSWLLGNGWKPREIKGTTGLGHDHEWDEVYHYDDTGNWVINGNWVYCWICGQKKLWKENEKVDTKKS